MCGVYSALYLYVQTYLLPRSPALAPHEDIMSIARITTRKNENKGQSPGQTHRRHSAEGSEEGGRTGKRKRKRKLPRGGWYPPFGLHHETDTRPHRVRTVLMYLTTYAYYLIDDER